MMLSCDSEEGGVWVLDPQKFMMLFGNEVGSWRSSREGVVILKNFERLTGSIAERCLFTIGRFCMGNSNTRARLVLWSQGDVSAEMRGIHQFSPIIVRLTGTETDPHDLNARVQTLIDEASRITEVPIKRISEEAANFLEESYYSCEGEELLVLLVEGIRRSDGRTLRFRDLLPNFTQYFDSDDPLETYCN